MTATTKQFRAKLEELAIATIRQRDEEWTRALGIPGKALTPKEAAKWLEADRRKQVNEVIAARPRRGPQHY